MFTLDAERILAELHRRGATSLRTVRFRANRSRLLSVSRDGRRLNAHACFADAPPPVLDAVAAFLTARPGSTAQHDAVRRIRAWDGSRLGIARARAAAAGRRTRDPASPPRPGPCCASHAERRGLRDLYQRLNGERFLGRLPADLHVRLSARMRRRLGHVRYHRTPGGERVVVEIAIQRELVQPGHEAELSETMLHEMAHVEAWLVHGHAGHGRIWKHIARRVGCTPRACRPPEPRPA